MITFLCGSDQVWNPNFGRLTDVDLLKMAKPEQKVAFSASFGIEKLPKKEEEKAKKALQSFKTISVREERAKYLIEDLVKRKDVEVLVDPTMLLTAEQWGALAKRPENLKTDKYILTYFLGKVSEERTKEIERVAKENHCQIINILDKNTPIYQTGPSEFLYLEKNAFFICTDSFHSSVFAILFHRPFVVFDREDTNQKMNSRLNTLLQKFDLQNAWYQNKITEEQLQINTNKLEEKLEEERKKAEKFIKNALN